MTDRRVNYAVVGCGVMGRVHAQAAHHDDNSRVAYCVDIDGDRARELASETGAEATSDYEVALRDPDLDAVIVCLPHDLHRDYCVAAAQAGRHVMVEKPIAVTMEEADDIIDAARENDVLLLVAHVLRLEENFVRLKQLIDGNTLGRPIMGRIHSDGYVSTSQKQYSYGPWYETKGQGGSTLGGAIHHSDLMSWLLGNVENVTGFELSNRPEYGAIEEPDFSLIVYEIEGGALGETTYSYSTFASQANQLPTTVVAFERGTASILPGGEFRVYDSDEDVDDGRSSVNIYRDRNSVRPASAEVPKFSDSILNGAPLFITPAEARRALELALAASHSAKTRATVNV